jgi:selenophosphate synthase
MYDVYEVSGRDKFAVALANFVLNVFATKGYRDILSGTIEYGMRAAVRDKAEGRSAPPDWRR